MAQEVTENQKITKPCLIDFKDLKATKTTDFMLPLLGFTKNFASRMSFSTGYSFE